MATKPPPGRLIGSGRAADVFEIDDRRVLRRYRTGFDAEPEASLMQYLRAAGFPVPQVFDAAGADLVLERLSGRDMLADLAKRPWRAAGHARTLAGLHDRLHEIDAPLGLQRPFGTGNKVMHLDLHPGNVMLTAAGPVVIDWSNGAAGPPGADVAIASLIMQVSEVDSLPAPVRLVAGQVRARVVRSFEAHVSCEFRPHLKEAADLRIRDPNVRPAEIEQLRRIVARTQPGR
jgi:tRNA A-37 threonylcarbamoyl transferase component Bud32